jgi:hypothetical protein
MASLIKIQPVFQRFMSPHRHPCDWLEHVSDEQYLSHK